MAQKVGGRQLVIDNKQPMTREDVERLTKVNANGSQGLFLRGRNFQGANLDGANLQGTFLVHAELQGANLRSAELQGANLVHANLQGADLDTAELQDANLGHANLQGADLRSANLQGADLRSANFQGANLESAELQGANLRSANLQSAKLNDIRLDEYIDMEDAIWGYDYISGLERDEKYKDARSSYRQLKTWHKNHSYDDIAGEFHYREWECKRKLAKRQRDRLHAGQLTFYRLLFGYGERPWRLALAGAGIMLAFAVCYFPYSWSFCFNGACWRAFGIALAKTLYFSGVSFTALGYGAWVTEADTGPLRYLGFVESLIGVLLLALFLVTFTRKLMR